MFGITQERLINNLKIMKKAVCAYGSDMNQVCDCKYGKGDEKAHKPMHEAFSGCCELSLSIKLIEAMTSEEFIEFCKRTGIIDPDILIDKTLKVNKDQ